MTPIIRNISTAVLATTLCLGVAQAATDTTPSDAATITVDERPVPQLTQRDLDEQLWLNALTGNVNALTQLVSLGANPRIATSHGETALHAAAARGHIQVVSFLLRRGGVSIHSQTSNGWTPLHHAARFGHATVANFLVRSGANPRLTTRDAGRKTPIDIALDKGDLRMARILGW